MIELINRSDQFFELVSAPLPSFMALLRGVADGGRYCTGNGSSQCKKPAHNYRP
jgi:hypothetical protein